MESEPGYLYSITFLLFIPLLGFPPTEVILSICFIIVLLLGSALISSSEVAFFSLSHNDLQELENEEQASSKRIIQLQKFPRILLATILICNNFINIAIVIVSEFLFRQILPPEICQSWADRILNTLALPWSVESLSRGINFLITTVVVTFLLVLFGEVAPKVYAKLNNIKIARMMSLPLMGLNRFFSPLSNLLVKGTSIIERRLEKSTQNGNSASREEIDKAIELTVSNNGTSDKKEVDILKGIVKFGEVSVKQIMRSRVDVVGIDFRISFVDLMKVVKESGYSRLPVYEEDLDHIVGILYVKDLLPHIDKTDEDFEWQELIRANILYVPEAKKINDLLKEFQSQRLHMGIVVDEYGGSSGIVTLEDIMEEVIGEIRDEFDAQEDVDYEKIDDFNYSFEGKTLLNDVCRVIGVDTTTFDEVKGDADSVAGLVLEVLGDIPRKKAEVAYENYRFKILSVNKRRIEKIMITLPQEQH